MSGGGGGRPDDVGPSGPSLNCDIVKEVPLNSPQEDVIANLSPGQELNVQLRNNVVVAVTDNNEVAGSLTYSGFTTLITCMNQGHSYLAQVIEVDEGRCLVRIHPAS